jgi:phosphohistidine phosphatase
LNLLIMRHGDALMNSSSDFERLLSPLGADQATDAGVAIKEYGVDVQRVYCSPLPRAKRTAEIVAAAVCPDILPITWQELAPGADSKVIADMLVSEDGALIVTHQPFASRLVYYLTGDEVGMATGAVACILAELLEPTKCALKWLAPE